MSDDVVRDLLFQYYFRDARDPQLLLNSAKKVADANNASLRFFECRRDELIGRSFEELGVGSSESGRYLVTLKDGRRQGFYCLAEAIHSDHGEWRLLTLEAEAVAPRIETGIPYSDVVHNPDTSHPPHISIWTLDRDYRYTFFNDTHSRLMKEFWGARIAEGVCILDYIDNPEYRELVRINYEKVFKGLPHRSMDKLNSGKGPERYFENFGSPIFDKEHQIEGILLYSVDVTWHITTQNRLHRNLALLKSIMNSPEGVLILSIDRQYRYQFFNNAHREAMKKIWGVEPALGKSIWALLPESSHRQHLRAYYDRALAGEPESLVSELPDQQGNLHFYENIPAPVRDEQDNITGLTLFILDITKRINMEQELQRSVREKERLLKEIHHRVKNNLQLVTSMLSLQQSMESDERTRHVLADSQNRIATMAFLHKALYRDADLDHVVMEEYIIPLVESLQSLYDDPGKRIAIITDFEAISLSVDQAVPLGLIITELCTNSLKYAFSGRSAGEIRIVLRRDEERYQLSYEDDGAGLPDDFSVDTAESLGMQLITAFAQQLEGELEYNSADKGFRALLRF